MLPKIGQIYLYDFFTLLGYPLAAGYLYRVFFRSVPRGKLLLVLLGGFLASLYGGTVIPFIYRFLTNDAASTFLGSGRYFHSAFLAGILYGVVSLRWLRYPVRKGLDHLMIAFLFMSAVGRLGCFFEGCCMGKPTKLPWGLRFPDDPLVPVHPTQLYMLGMELILVWVLMRINSIKCYDGQTFWIGVWLYSIYRIWIEMLRTNPIFVSNLTHAQVFSMVTLVLASWMLLHYRKHPPRLAP